MGEMVVDDLPLVTDDSGPIGLQSQEHAPQLSAADERWFALPIRRGDAVVGVSGSCSGARIADDESSLRSIAELLRGLQNARLFEAERAARQQAHRPRNDAVLLEASALSTRCTDWIDAQRPGHRRLNASKHTRVYVALLAEDRLHATFVTTVATSPSRRTVSAWDQLSSVLQDVLTDGRPGSSTSMRLPKSQHGVADSLAYLAGVQRADRLWNSVLGHIAMTTRERASQRTADRPRRGHRLPGGRGHRERPALRRAASHRGDPSGELRASSCRTSPASSWAWCRGGPTNPSSWAATSATSSWSMIVTSSRSSVTSPVKA